MIDDYTARLARWCQRCPAAQRSGTSDHPSVMHREFDRWNGIEVVAVLPVTRGATFLRSVLGYENDLDYRRDRIGD